VCYDWILINSSFFLDSITAYYPSRYVLDSVFKSLFLIESISLLFGSRAEYVRMVYRFFFAIEEEDWVLSMLVILVSGVGWTVKPPKFGLSGLVLAICNAPTRLSQAMFWFRNYLLFSISTIFLLLSISKNFIF